MNIKILSFMGVKQMKEQRKQNKKKLEVEKTIQNHERMFAGRGVRIST